MAANTHSLSFSGAGTRDVPHIAGINFGSGSYTISFWFRKASIPGTTEALFHKVNTGNNWPLTASIMVTTGYLRFQQWNGTTNPTWNVNVNVCDNVWHYITVVLNDSGTNRAFSDGVARQTATHLAVTTTNNFRLNEDSDASGAGTFKVDELTIYNVALSGDTAYGRRDKQHSVEGYTNLQGEYPLNNNANDSSSNANNMTGTGGTFDATDVPFANYGDLTALVNQDYAYFLL